MKAKPETTLFTVLTGSHLYGTASAASDYDYKAVVLPALDDLLLNVKITNRHEKPEGVGPDGKMPEGEAETEYLPLQVFLNDAFKGQTYSIEICQAVLQDRFEVPSVNEQVLKHRYQQLISEFTSRFLTCDVKAMVGYAISQSKVYGLKTERYESLVKVRDMIEKYFNMRPTLKRRETRLSETFDLLDDLYTLDHVQASTLLNARGGMAEAPALEICGKKHTYTTYWQTVLDSVEATLVTYGHRVKEFAGAKIDWKALSHAIRIAEQVLELCSTGFLKFPRPNAPYLLAVKSGQVPLEQATEYLQEQFLKVDTAVEESVLPLRTPELEAEFREWKIKLLRELYEVD